VTAFDGASYKETTRLQWQDAAGAWHRWDPVFDRWLGEATDLMLDRAGVRAGSRVLDIAAGSGGQSLAAARRGAHVLATDISSNILGEAEAAAQAAGLELETRVVDGEELDVEPASFDAAISRLGLMYLPDKQRGLTRAAAALRSGGRYGAIVFSEPDRNAFFVVPISIIRRHGGLSEPAPGGPGPFSAANLGELLEESGFTAVEVHRVVAPLRLASSAEYTQLARESFGALHAMLAGLSERRQDAAWVEVEEALRAFDGPDGFVGPCELLVGVGVR
jgi:ubiquinone/menaquinone biosynthesis C-methylase UbiE